MHFLSFYLFGFISVFGVCLWCDFFLLNMGGLSEELDEMLFDACKRGDIGEAKKYLSQGANVNFKDEVCVFVCFVFVLF